MERLYDAGWSRESLDRHVATLASGQHGVFARTQVARLGATKDMIAQRVTAGRWERLGRDVFRLAGSPRSWRQSLMAACLGWGEGAVVSHRAAAALRLLAGCMPGPVELTVPLTRRRSAPGTIHRNVLPPVDVTTVEGIPVTTVARTLMDIASVAPRDTVEEALDDALRRGLVTMPRLRWRLSELGRSGRPGTAVIRSLIDARDPRSSVPQSVFETRLLRVLKEAGLPRPILQHEVRDGRRVVAVVDFAFPAIRVAIEAEGYRWHSGRARWERDLARRNALTSLGWRVVHVTWTELTANREDMIGRIERVVRSGP